MPAQGDDRGLRLGVERYREHPQRLMWLLALLLFTDVFGYAIVLPLLPLAATRRGAGVLTVGALFATYSLCQLVCAPLLGYWSDRRGRRPVLLLSLLGSAGGFALMLAGGLWPLALSRVVDGATAGNVFVVYAVLLDEYPEGEWGRRLALLATSTGLGILAGIGVSALVAGRGLAAAAGIAMVLSLISAALVWQLLPETARKVPMGATGVLWRQLLTPHQMVRGAILAGLFSATLQSAFLLALPIFLFRLLGFHEVQSGIVIAGLVAAAAAFQAGVVTRLMKVLTPRDVTLTGFALAALGGTAAILARDAPWAIAAATGLILGAATLAPAVTALIGVCHSQYGKGAIMGLSQSMASAGNLAGPLLGYGALQLFSTPGYGGVCTALAVVGALLTMAVLLPARSRERERDPASDHPPT
jgi:DHA1 family tetracycline resistance protein-like MFS transporter